MDLSGYVLEALRNEGEFALYRGRKHDDPASVLVLAHVAGQPAPANLNRLQRDFQAPAPPEVIAGTLAYMAPEQTGRMNRSIDARSDLYSLGVTLYEMLTAALPFSGADPLEWVHCHIARQPIPFSERARGIPQAVEAVILKLLA